MVSAAARGRRQPCDEEIAMNSIVLFFRGIKASVKQNPIIYGAFIFFYLFSTIVSIYVIGKYSGDIIAYGDYRNSLTTFNLYLDWNDGTPVSEIKEALTNTAADPNVDYIKLMMRDKLIDWDVQGAHDDEKKTHFATAYVKNENKMILEYFKKSGIDNIDAAEFADSDNLAVIIENLNPTDKTHSSETRDNLFKIQNSSYNVSAELAWGENDQSNHLISYKSVLKNDLRVMMIDVKYDQISTYNEIETIANRLGSEFGCAVDKPVERDFNVESILSISNIIVYLVIILSAVNYIYIFRYVLEKRRQHYEIYSLCGCPNKKIVLFAVVEILLVSIVQTIVGIVLFHLAIKPLVISLEPLLKYSFDNTLYIAVFGLSVMIGVVVLTVEFLILRKGRVK